MHESEAEAMLTSAKEDRPRCLVLGLGNEALSDDRVGLIAARRIASESGIHADVREACHASIDLLPVIEGYDRLIVIDAIWGEEWPPGTQVRRHSYELMVGVGHRSPHSMSFAEIVELGRRLGLLMPQQVIIYALAVSDPFTFGETLSPPVAEAFDAWVSSILSHESATQ